MDRPSSFPGYRFGPFELDPDGYRLLHSGEPVELQPRVFDLLAYLVANAERLVTKDELVAEVWHGRSVGDDALTRAIYEARRALSADEDGVYIETIRGRGYRFAVPVQQVPLEENSDRSSSASGDSPSSEPNRTDTRVAGVREPQKHQRSRSLRRWAGALAGALAVAVLVSAWSLGRGGASADLDPDPDEPPFTARVAVLAPSPSSSVDRADPELRFLGTSLGERLFARLHSLDGLVVKSDPAGLAQEIPSLMELGAALGVDYVVAGELERRTDVPRVTVSMALHDVRQARLRTTPLYAGELPLIGVDPDLDALLRAREAIARRVVELLAPALGGRELPSAGDRPRDAEAYRLYLLGRERLRGAGCDQGAAIELLQRSIERDPGVAEPWILLAVAFHAQVWSCGAAADRLDEALGALEQARRIDPASPIPGLMTSNILIASDRAAEALAISDQLLAAHASDPRVLLNRSYLLRYAGDLEGAQLALDRALEVDPQALATSLAGDTPNVHLYAANWQRFLDLLPAGDTPFLLFYRGLVEVSRGSHEAARPFLEEAFRRGPGDIFGRLSHALLEVVKGRQEVAAEIVDGIARQRRQLGATDGEITYKEAQIYALAGEHERAVERLLDAVEEGFFCTACFELDPNLAELSERGELAQVLEAAREKEAALASSRPSISRVGED